MAKGKGTTKTVEEMNIQNVQEEVVETIEKNVETTSSVILEENKKEVEEKTEPLKDTDEIKVISLIPNVSYKDKATGDYYKWNAVNDSELMTFETLKNMNRNHKSYLRDLWLKPLDKRANHLLNPGGFDFIIPEERKCIPPFELNAKAQKMFPWHRKSQPTN